MLMIGIISHVDKKAVEYVIKQLNVRFRKESPLCTRCSKVLEYLCMTIDYTKKESRKNLRIL